MQGVFKNVDFLHNHAVNVTFFNYSNGRKRLVKSKYCGTETKQNKQTYTPLCSKFMPRKVFKQCGSGFERKKHPIDGFGQKIAQIDGFPYPYSPPSLRNNNLHVLAQRKSTWHSICVVTVAFTKAL